MKSSTRATCCGANKQARLAYTMRTVPAHSVAAPAPYIHTSQHTHSHTRVTCEIHAHAHAAPLYYDPLQQTSSMCKAKDKAHGAHGQKEIMHAYGPKSTPIAQGLVEDINALHAFWLRESQRTCGSVSTPIAQGLVEIINAKEGKW